MASRMWENGEELSPEEVQARKAAERKAQISKGDVEGDGQGFKVPKETPILCPKCGEKSLGKLRTEGIMSSIMGLAGFAAITMCGKIRLPRVYCKVCKKWYKMDHGTPLKEDIVYNFALSNIIPRD